MKVVSENIQHLKHTLGILTFLIFPTLLSAQIPQNIEVDGEAADGWQYLLWILVLLFIVAAVFLILRMVNRRKEKEEEKSD